MQKNTKRLWQKSDVGFTLIETVVSIGIFAILATTILQVYTLIIHETTINRDQAVVSLLADQYIEMARNLPYADIGTIHGDTCDKPNNQGCTLPDLASPATANFNGVDYSIYYAISYVDDPADGTALAGTDSAPNDYKQLKLYITNTTTSVTKNFLTIMAPKGLETLGSRGALAIKVFNAVGQPVSGATIHIVNSSVTPTIDITRTSDQNGNWLEVGLPPSTNGYHITASKSGYSADQTYTITVQNPNPVKPDATIAIGQVTQISFSIDVLSSLAFYTSNQTCQAMSGIELEVRGAKLIGNNPNVYKFDSTYTSASDGKISPKTDPNCSDNQCLEWDNYTPALISNSYMVYGSSPIQYTNILPGTTQNFTLLLGPKTSYSLLVIIKDSASGNPVEGASVDLQDPNSGHTVKITGGSVWRQEDWSGGPGQNNFTDTTMYFGDDGGVSSSGVPSGLRLLKTGNDYVSSGYVISSSFDTGTDQTSYTTLDWQPLSQDPSTTIKFQTAANNNNTTWNFTGPDGTGASYYTVPGTTLSSVNNNKRYIRYKVFLSTEDPSKTPVLTGVNLNYISGCFTPGQAMFSELQQSTGGYRVTVAKAGYQDYDSGSLDITGYDVLEVLLNQ